MISFRDELAVIDAIIPEGPIAILGLVGLDRLLLRAAFLYKCIKSRKAVSLGIVVHMPASTLTRTPAQFKLCHACCAIPQGSGTIARIINSFAPHRKLHGWELDAEVLEVSKQYLGLESLLEKGALVSRTLMLKECNNRACRWHIIHQANLLLALPQVTHIEDAFTSEISAEGGFAGIIVDIFVEAAIHPELMKVRHVAKQHARVPALPCACFV